MPPGNTVLQLFWCNYLLLLLSSSSSSSSSLLPPLLTTNEFSPSGSSPYTSTNISYIVKSKLYLQKNERPLYGETANWWYNVKTVANSCTRMCTQTHTNRMLIAVLTATQTTLLQTPEDSVPGSTDPSCPLQMAVCPLLLVSQVAVHLSSELAVQ